MAFARQRISAQRIARPMVAAFAAGQCQREPCRGCQCPVPGGARSAKLAGITALAVQH